MPDDLHVPGGALLAEFAEPDSARNACVELRARGHKRIQTYSPHPLLHSESEEGARWLTLGVVVFLVAVLAGAIGYAVQWYTNAVSYPLNIGGRPANAVIAFVIPMVESVILLGGITAFIGLLVSLRLPRLWQPVFEIDGFERASVDRYWVAVGLKGSADAIRTTSLLKALNPLRIVHMTAGQ